MDVKPLDKPVTFVVPWYGDKIAGGAERLCREYARRLAQAEIQVEVLTTCVRDFSSNWNRNHHPAKTVVKDGVTVHRFPVRRRDNNLFDIVNFKLLNNLTVTAHEEHAFFFESIRSEKMERFLAQNCGDHHLVFLPYCFGTTFEGLRQIDHRGFLLPCLHHERYAMLRGSRKMHEGVCGLIFNSQSERELANTFYSIDRVPQIVLGMGVEDQPPADPDLFRQKHRIKNPYLICVGRKDVTKNTHVLVGYFAEYIKDNPETEIDLVLIGDGDVEIPKEIARRVHSPGYVPEDIKRSALAGAKVLVQPSARESFSIVLMEAWLAGTPVAVNEYCAVGVEHCRATNGGLYFGNYAEFSEVIRLLTSNGDLAKKLAENGRRHILERFRWDRLIGEFVEFIREHGSQ